VQGLSAATRPAKQEGRKELGRTPGMKLTQEKERQQGRGEKGEGEKGSRWEAGRRRCL